ncbi:hypothetical protein BC828DRAFT_408056 [Blastocladiella britannica]|nr:hypothetical protein BC828DRAFT_408056 [Blastocladiella britannica]
MAGGPQTYIVGGVKLPSRFLAIASLAAYVGAGMFITRGSSTPAAPVAQQIQALPADEGDFVSKFMAELEQDEAKAAH